MMNNKSDIQNINGEDKLISIQILRCIACISVFVVHFGQRTYLSGMIRNLTDIGANGPQLFFLISGYLAAKKLIPQKTPIFIYYKKRMITLLPLYYFVIFYFFVFENICRYFSLNAIPNDKFNLGWARYFFLLNGIIPWVDDYWSNLGMTWSIPVFIFFYLIAPLILPYLNSLLKAIIIWFIASVVGLGINLLFVHFYHGRCTIATSLHIFFLGIIVYYLFQNRETILGALIFSFMTIPILAIKRLISPYIMIFAIIILLSIELEKRIKVNGCFKKFINYIDEYSYALYLMQGVFICSIIDKIKNKFPHWQIGIMMILGTIIATWLGHNYIELPIQNYYRKKNFFL